MTSARTLYVTGHKNPDTDSLVAAHVFAWMLRGTDADPGIARAVAQGPAGPQAAWLFAQAGEPLPEIRTDCRPTVGEVCAPVATISPEAPLSSAIRILRERRAPLVAVVDEDGTIKGTISERMPQVGYLLSANIEDMLGSLLDWHHLVDGLGLKPVNNTPLAREPRGLKLIIDSMVAAQQNDVLVTGTSPHDPVALLASDPAAIIVVGPDTCEAFANQTNIPVYAYHGSVFAFCASLGGCVPCLRAIDTRFRTIEADEILSESRHAIAAAPDGLLVVDDEKLMGLLSARQLAETPRPRVALVDHFERSQSIDGLGEAEIVAIIDHHRIGDIETPEPVDVDCRIWGSTASILFARCKESGIAVPAGIAKLLLGALVADTLLLQSPTTRERDRQIADELAQLADVSLQEFGMDVLRHNDQLGTGDPADLVSADCKTFTHGNVRFQAAQIETVDISVLNDSRRAELKHAMLARLGSTAFGVLMVTDVLRQLSQILVVAESAEWREKILPEPSSNIWTAEGFVSRKKQLIPHIIRAISS